MSYTPTKPSHVIRRNGVFFTPDILAVALAGGVRVRHRDRVLDPACGNGILLRAVRDAFQATTTGPERKVYLVGCDRLDHTHASSRDADIKIYQKDFFAFQPAEKFDLVVMNPPYLSGARFPNKIRYRLNRQFGGACRLPSNADIWTYFLIKAVDHLKEGGGIAAVLPWPFLQATYSSKLRSWLSERFDAIRSLIIGSQRFERTNTRVLLLWMSGYGKPAKTIELGFLPELGQTVEYSAVTPAVWGSAQMGTTNVLDAQRVLDECVLRHRFAPLGKHATVRIGVVTGANSFFIRSKGDEVLTAFKGKDRTRIITSGKAVNELRLNGEAIYSFLLRFHPGKEREHERVVNAGRRAEVHKRSHSARRRPWHAVDIGDIPDAFFHYRVNDTPFIAINEGRYQCTNAVHRLYFKQLSEDQLRWIQISALSVFGQLSIEAVGRVYGNGILKVEPAGLKKILVWTGTGKVPAKAYSKLERLITAGRRREAVGCATAIICAACGISPELARDAETALDTIRIRRQT
jgi:adenine-specific DNA-methyltransferase